jgi:hypothetical protein
VTLSRFKPRDFIQACCLVLNHAMRRLRRFIVHKQEQVDLLTKLGAKLIVNSSNESFKKDLYKAIDATGATLAFDAMDQIKGSGYLILETFTDCADCNGYSIILLICRCVFSILKNQLNC